MLVVESGPLTPRELPRPAGSYYSC